MGRDIIVRHVIGFEGFNEVLGILALVFSFELSRKVIEILETPIKDILSVGKMMIGAKLTFSRQKRRIWYWCQRLTW